MSLKTCLASLLLALSGLTLSFSVQAQNGVRHIHQERSLYRNIVVTEDTTRRCMRFTLTNNGGQNQSCRLLDNHDTLVFPYAKMVLSSLLLQDNPQRILIIGLGGGTLVHAYSTLFPQAQQIIVEIDEAVVSVAEDYFDFRQDERVKVETVDGRVYVKRAGLRGEKFDLIILDAFNGEYIPEHLMSQEFLQEVKALLPEHGLVVANTFSTSKLYDAESSTYASVFGQFFNIRQFGTGNRVIITGLQPLPDDATLKQRAEALYPRLTRFDMDVREYPALMETGRDWNINARLLTDQYSPANLLNN